MKKYLLPLLFVALLFSGCSNAPYKKADNNPLVIVDLGAEGKLKANK